MEVSLNKLQEIVEESCTAAYWHATVHGVAEFDKTEQLNGTELIKLLK